ncbi:hypothetical protein B0T24DRAFT_636116 [Lasiosphaeria ovina]|uniref:Uncharacterized protein n=1 Tax=Lasiosphaeria ovina TaxID=92902 RepID=A0AAE0JWW9_9PEZI|nr:hypothetical protein B0T24DRAFT_636116 [Lasiosphaeria ovina]
MNQNEKCTMPGQDIYTCPPNLLYLPKVFSRSETSGVPNLTSSHKQTSLPPSAPSTPSRRRSRCRTPRLLHADDCACPTPLLQHRLQRSAIMGSSCATTTTAAGVVSPTRETMILFAGMDRVCSYPSSLDHDLTLDDAVTGGRENYYTAQLVFEWPDHDRFGYIENTPAYEFRASDVGASSLEVSIDESDLAERDVEKEK